MADKNITLRQKNTSGVYDKLYTKTTATQSKLSTETAALFGDGTSDADAALAKIADTVKSIGDVQVKVVDPNGNPIQGARITGLYGTPITASDGTAHGVLQTNPISISSPYIDLKDQTADASGYAGSFDVLTVTLPIVGENSITRVTSSKTVKFSKVVKTVDVCCVGGGGGGTVDGHYSVTGGWSGNSGCGGGGGAIVNGYGLSITALTSYPIIIGNGAAVAISDPNLRGQGGTTSFLTISAQGGYSGYFERVYASSTSYYNKPYSGAAGAAGCGDGGGGSNTTVSEFNDGVTFYSGGGGNGFQNGGSPNGANGVTYASGTSSSYYLVNATTAGIGGGGGGGGGMIIDGNMQTANGSAGGPGLVAIKFHF